MACAAPISWVRSMAGLASVQAIRKWFGAGSLRIAIKGDTGMRYPLHFCSFHDLVFR
jgi:hypothetical protein